jgi:hypothetical protein
MEPVAESLNIIDETFSFYSENNPFEFISFNNTLSQETSFNLFDTNLYQINDFNYTFKFSKVVSEKVYTDHTKEKKTCPICMEPEDKDGLLLQCCQNKQFVCDQCTTQMKNYQQDTIDEQNIDLQILTCPFCRKKVKV